jgi:hypothetical protein
LVCHTKGITQIKRVFEERVLKRIFEPKREQVTGGRRRMMKNFIICSTPG